MDRELTAYAIWPGTSDEGRELAMALARNCACVFGELGERVETCLPHRLVTTDQHWLNHLVFVRRMRERLQAEEGVGECQA